MAFMMGVRISRHRAPRRQHHENKTKNEILGKARQTNESPLSKESIPDHCSLNKTPLCWPHEAYCIGGHCRPEDGRWKAHGVLFGHPTKGGARNIPPTLLLCHPLFGWLPLVATAAARFPTRFGPNTTLARSNSKKRSTIIGVKRKTPFKNSRTIPANRQYKEHKPCRA